VLPRSSHQLEHQKNRPTITNKIISNIYQKLIFIFDIHYHLKSLSYAIIIYCLKGFKKSFSS
jgi:hypothetical protein